MGGIKPPRHPETGRLWSDYQGTTHKSQALIAACELSPYWRVIEPRKWRALARDRLERWGLAEFRRLPHCDKGHGLLGRLTAKGLRFRDYWHQRQAEDRDVKRRRDLASRAAAEAEVEKRKGSET